MMTLTVKRHWTWWFENSSVELVQNATGEKDSDDPFFLMEKAA
jgi:hypothetical protein